MTYFLWAVLLLVALILQGSISFFDIAPNLTVIMACYAGIKKREIKGMLIGSAIGVIEDSLSGTLLGPHFLSKGLIGYLSSLTYSRFFIWTPLLGIITMILLTFLDGLVIFVSRSIFDKMPVNFGVALFVLFIQSLLNAPFGLILKPKTDQE
jgi:rod shape-determining protein MreD